MVKINYETTYFKLSYPNIIINHPSPVIELYISSLYTKFKEIYLEKCKDNNINLNSSILLDILSYFVIDNDNVDGIIFSNKNSYSIKIIKSFVDKILNKTEIINFKTILNDMRKISKKNYNYIKKNISKLNKIKYKFKTNKQSKFIEIKLIIMNSDINKKIDESGVRNTVYVKNIIYNSLIRNYNIVNYQNHENRNILDDKFIERVFILYTRYYTFSNGNNQSSIQPSFKLMLKKYLNIKIELFGSAINTSNRYCSLFYDIEKYFGSMGNFFEIDIKRGYFEINPPYEDNIMNDVFHKIYKSLVKSEKTKEPLLFLFVIPKRDLQTFSGYKKLEKYVTYNNLIKKKNFPFLRYDRYLSKTILSPIVDVIIFLAHNDYIEDIYKSNAKKINLFISKWISKNKSK